MFSFIMRVSGSVFLFILVYTLLNVVGLGVWGLHLPGITLTLPLIAGVWAVWVANR